MKKKLEADLISIAHRILQLKNKSDINKLYLETQKLYEKLAVLRFVETHFSEAKPTIGYPEVVKEIESIFEKKWQELEQPESDPTLNPTTISETTPDPVEKIVETPLVSETIIDTAVQDQALPPAKIALDETQKRDEQNTQTPLESVEKQAEKNQILAETVELETAPFVPAFELSQIEEVEAELEVPKKAEAVQISFEDLLGGNYHDTLFVKKTKDGAVPEQENRSEITKPSSLVIETVDNKSPKSVSLNEKLAKGITIDLNDRIAFIKHLFGNSSEDYNRVLSQLITFDSFYEARDFVQKMVKPDYNNWEGKQEYQERFMDIIEKKFL